MLSFTFPPPLYALLGVIFTALAAIWQARRVERADKRKNSGTVASSSADVLWAASEQIRHDLRDQVDRLQTELHEVKDMADKWRTRVEELEDELFDLSERLRREEETNVRPGTKPPAAGK